MGYKNNYTYFNNIQNRMEFFLNKEKIWQLRFIVLLITRKTQYTVLLNRRINQDNHTSYQQKPKNQISVQNHGIDSIRQQ